MLISAGNGWAFPCNSLKLSTMSCGLLDVARGLGRGSSFLAVRTGVGCQLQVDHCTWLYLDARHSSSPRRRSNA
jgi:hypothetical protein